MHIVSNVGGGTTARQNRLGFWLKSLLPRGTVSGAPKNSRHADLSMSWNPAVVVPTLASYGYYDFEGQLNTAITIRTMVVQAGGRMAPTL